MSLRTMSPDEAAARVLDTRLITILRGFTQDQAVAVGEALAAGGARVIEVSLVDAQALACISSLVDALGERLLIGAGTVLTADQATAAFAAGADFLFSPGLNTAVLAAAAAHDRLAIPGVLTATEITAALSLDRRLVKLFPAEPLGPTYLRQLLGPFPDLQVIATGGVGAANAAAYFEAGAVAVGAGTSIANPAWAHANQFQRFEAAARALLDALPQR